MDCNIPEPNPMPSATTATMPSMVGTSLATTPSPQPILTVQTLSQRLPQIVNPGPAVIPMQARCNTFAQWVGQNPMLAGGALLVIAFMVLGDKK